jgi:predicted RNA binding protein YcfA (HicA-like mRNA interferase family)
MLGKADCAFLRSVIGGRGTNVTYADLARLLQRAGWTLAGTSGSHRTWRKPKAGPIVLVDAGAGEILPVYAKRAARTLLEDGACGK